MNNQRRKDIATVGELLPDIPDDIEAAKSKLEEILEEEQEYFDNMPESFQGGDKGDTAQATIDALQEAIDSLDQAAEAVNNAISSIETAGE